MRFSVCQGSPTYNFPPFHLLPLGNDRRESIGHTLMRSSSFVTWSITLNTNEKMDNVGVLSLLIAHPTFYPFFKATKEEWSLARPFCRRRLLPNRMGNCSGVENRSTTTLWEIIYSFFFFFLTAFIWCVIFKKFYFFFLVQILISILSDFYSFRNNTVEIAKIIVKRKTFKWRTTTTTTNQQTKKSQRK